MIPWRLLIVLTAWTASGASLRADAEPPRYSGEFADGTYIADGQLEHWGDEKGFPRLSGRALFDKANPIRWIRNRSLSPGTMPEAYVELFGGDRLPGQVTGCLPAGRSHYRRDPAFLMVEPTVSLSFPKGIPGSYIAVTTTWVRRIIWHGRADDRYVPGTLYYRDGRQTTFRKVRLMGDRVLLLLDDGPKEIRLDEIAELHMPRQDPWDVYFSQMAVLSPDGQARAMRIETDQGLVVTTSVDRVIARYQGNHTNPDDWYHVVQPAWSPRPFWVPNARVHTRSFYLPHEVPLFAIDPVETDRTPSSGGGWSAKLDRNVRGSFLRSGGQDAGWGVGVHAESRLRFSLPEQVRSFRTRIGLDRTIGRGGCVRAAVYVNQTQGKPIYQSKYLIGSSRFVDTGEIALQGAAAGQRDIVLLVDSAHQDRPKGTDPLDIRDVLDWLLPVVTLDADWVLQQIRMRLHYAIPAWQGWKADIAGGRQSPVEMRWDVGADDGSPLFDPRFVVETVGGPRAIALSSRRRIPATAKWLMLSVHQTIAGSRPGLVKVRIDGQVVALFEVPQRRGNRAPEPFLIPIQDYRQREVLLEVIHMPSDERSRFQWQSLSVIDDVSPADWTTLWPSELRSSEGTTLVCLPDGSILATGKNPERERLTVSAETKLRRITAVRLEVLTDRTLPGRGPGRAANGNFRLSEFRLVASTLDERAKPRLFGFGDAMADYSQTLWEVIRAIDGNVATGWSVDRDLYRPHVAIFALKEDPTFPGGTRLTFALDHQAGGRQVIGRFRLSVTTDALPIEPHLVGTVLARPADVTAKKLAGRRHSVFQDEEPFLKQFDFGLKNAHLERDDRFAGSASLRISRGEAGRAAMDKVKLPIREHPVDGEYRYIRFAWKKRGGEQIALQFAHDGQWSLELPTGRRYFRYYAGPNDGAYPPTALQVHTGVPDEWVVVTRDLYADFGEINLTGFSFHCPDGEAALFDALQLTRSMSDFERDGP